MLKRSFVIPMILLFCFMIYPFGSALALSTGTGYMEVSAGIDYDSATLEFFPGWSALETWTIAGITASDPHETLAHDSQSNDDNTSDPGWETAPADSSIAYGDSTVNITNNHEDPMHPVGLGELAMSTSNVSNRDLTTYSSIIYIANVRAIGTGSFTFYVDYDAALAGDRDNTNEKIQLGASAQLNRYDMYYDDDDHLQYKNDGMSIARDYDAQWVQAENDALTTSIDNFGGRLSLTINYEAGEMFYLRFDSQASILGYTEEQTAPVPEPATFILLGSGLAGLAFYRRKRK